MTSRTKAIRHLIENSMYTVDEQQVAEAVLLRTMMRHAVPPRVGPVAEPASPAPAAVRSFRHAGRAPSFRLVRRRGADHSR